MVGGISGGAPAHEPHFNSQDNSNKNKLIEVGNELQYLMNEIEERNDLTPAHTQTIDWMKGLIQSILNAKPPPSPQLASQCNQIMNDLNNVLQDKQSGNIDGCLTNMQNALNTVMSALGD